MHSDTDTLNAKFRLNGIDIVSDSNTIENVLSGVTINLIKTQDSKDTAATLKITQASDAIKESIEEFISDFNTVITFLNDKTSINATTLERGSLAGDFTFLNLRINLRTSVIASVKNVASGNPASLREIGITLNRDGTLTLDDEEALTDALETSSTAVIDLFTAEDGLGDRLVALIDRFVPTGSLLDDARSSIKSRLSRVDSRVKSLNERLKLRERSLRQQFAGLQRVLSGLASQQAILNRFTRSSGSLFGLQSVGIGFGIGGLR